MGLFQRVLDLVQVEADVFEAAPTPGGLTRTFGGQVAAQALRAAGLTIGEGRPVHSLHAYFIRGGRPAEPIRFDVARTRDGRTFSTRSVTAVQEGKPIFELIASFHDEEPGEDWQAGPPPPVPAPQDLPPVAFPWLFGDDQPFEIRPIAPPDPGGFPVSHPYWFRVTEEVADDPALHTCLITFLSDVAVVKSARSPLSPRPYDPGISLDHTIWFHRPARADDWLLYTMAPAAHVGTRGLAQGSLWTADGTLIASVAQEALFR